MRSCASTHGDAHRFHRGGKRFPGGFTLLEMCMVLFIIAILFCLAMPAMQTAFTEQAVRGDGQQLALMVKAGMLQSADQHRPYVLDLTATTLNLHPLGGNVDDAAPDDVNTGHQLGAADLLLVPDPKKPNGWVAMPPTSWVFQPGELCPASQVRLARGNAWLELNFNALTGNVENESSYFP
ncbi:MAG TPA: prepilin-type N-terminal cleavage/methylation domain-containing protein [Candidatus Methylacidiphilales bacterium]|nr:prepilin-type N-terminal cleavage/methylation domain-containing protein [Candidatus Methylacidiphilales bacterium]